MPVTISTNITGGVTYTSSVDNPITITNTGGVGGFNMQASTQIGVDLGPGIEWTLDNAGEIWTQGSSEAVYDPLGTITNSGTIYSGGGHGVDLGGNATLGDAVFINTGSVRDLYNKYEPFDVPRDGTVSFTEGDGEVTNMAPGIIYGAQNAIMGYGNDAGTLAVTNHNFILGGLGYGIVAYENLAVTNTGTIDGGNAGIWSPHHNASTLASGPASNVYNAVGGTISGHDKFGVIVDGGLTLTNAGTIAGASAAVEFYAGFTNRLIDVPGAVFHGAILGGNTPGSSAVSTFELASGSSVGTLTGFGVSASITDFAQVVVDPHATWVVSGDNTLASGVTLTDAGSVTLATSLSGPGLFAFEGGGLTLTDDNGAAIAPTISGLGGNTIALTGVDETIAGFNGGHLTLGGSVPLTLTLAGSYVAGDFHADYANNATEITACFAAGSGVATDRGRVAVEDLCVGDRVFTASGRLAPIVWLGHRRTDINRHPRPHEVMPVRVRAGALGAGPERDLVLSPVNRRGTLTPFEG